MPGRSAAETVRVPVEPDRRRRLLILAICSSSLFMTYMDSTVLNVALPVMQRDFHASVAGLQWVVDAYLVVLAALLLLGGSTGDRVGRSLVFRAGLLTFSAGSLLCSLAPNLAFLVGFRMLQALGGCMLTPVSLSIVRTTFSDAAERARALGIWSGIFGLATACGPIVGGVLVGFVGWRSVFWVNVPIGIVSFWLATRYIPESRSAKPRKMDPLGQILVILIMGCSTYAIIQGPTDGWLSAPILSCLAATGVGLTVLLVVELRTKEPLLEVRFFRSPSFSGANVIAVLSFVVMAGFLFVNTLYLQDVRGYSPLQAGLDTLPFAAVIALSAPFAGRMVARSGPRVPMAVAGACMAAGSALLLWMGPATSYIYLAGGYVLLGLGLGVVNPPITNTAVSSMPPSQAGIASAVTSGSRQVGNVMGVALMGSLLTGALRSGIESRLASGSISPSLRPTLARAARAGATALPRSGTAPHGALGILAQAFSSATHPAWALALACGAACCIIALVTNSPSALRSSRAVYADVDASSGEEERRWNTPRRQGATSPRAGSPS